MIKDQKTIFYLLLGISSFFVIALIFFNIKFIFDKRDMDNTTIKYKKTAHIYAEQTSSMNELKEEYDEKKANLLARIGAKGTTKYLDTVQKIASIFTKNEILVLTVTPKNSVLDIAKNFEILNDKDFENINEFSLQMFVEGKESDIVKSLDQTRRLTEHFYVKNIDLNHMDDETRGNTGITFSSNWNKNEYGSYTWYCISCSAFGGVWTKTPRQWKYHQQHGCEKNTI